jgi:hypothetical protein
MRNPATIRSYAFMVNRASSPPCHPGERVRRLRSGVSSIGQPIEIASRAVQPLLDGSRRYPSGCPAGLSGFLAIVPRRQCWDVLRLVHEPQHNRTAMEVRASERRLRPCCAINLRSGHDPRHGRSRRWACHHRAGMPFLSALDPALALLLGGRLRLGAGQRV